MLKVAKDEGWTISFSLCSHLLVKNYLQLLTIRCTIGWYLQRCSIWAHDCTSVYLQTDFGILAAQSVKMKTAILKASGQYEARAAMAIGVFSQLNEAERRPAEARPSSIVSFLLFSFSRAYLNVKGGAEEDGV